MGCFDDALADIIPIQCLLEFRMERNRNEDKEISLHNSSFNVCNEMAIFIRYDSIRFDSIDFKIHLHDSYIKSVYYIHGR